MSEVRDQYLKNNTLLEWKLVCQYQNDKNDSHFSKNDNRNLLITINFKPTERNRAILQYFF